MEPLVLLFNVTSEKAAALGVPLAALGLRSVEVPPAEFGQTLAALTGWAPKTAAACRAPFPQEMLVLAGFDDALLERFLAALKASGCPAFPLKAVMTPTNALWSAERLALELAKEHAQFAAQNEP